MRRRSLSAAVLLFASCFAPQQDVPVQTCAKCPEGTSGGGRSSGASTGGSAAGSSTGGVGSSSGGTAGGSSSSGGNASGGSTGGTTGGPADAGPLTGTVCPDGSVPFGGFIQDLCQSLAVHGKVPLGGVQVATLPPWGANVSSPDGGYSICLQPDTRTTLLYSKSGYIDAYSAQVEVNAGTPINGVEGTIAMVCNSAIAAYEAQTSLVPPFDPGKAAVYVLWAPLELTSPCGGEEDGGDAGLVSDQAGWTFQAFLADGGLPPDGGWPVGYFDYSGALQSSGQTFASGQALIYDIDPSAGYIMIQATKPGYTALCPLLDTSGVGGFTGLVSVEPNAFSFFPYAVP
ncbi:MAG TPA: hypothetical protein VMB50_20255 [Myxococcales bacterium]|nr:hypothetical protein [Myxococcales bacterium]